MRGRLRGPRLTDARRGFGLFGDDRVRSVLESSARLPAPAPAEALVQAAVEFPGHPADDIAVLVLRFEP